MLTAALFLLLAGPGAPSPTPVPKATPAPALSRRSPAEGKPSDLSSYAGKVKVDRSKAESIFRQYRSAPAPAATAPPASRTSAGAAAGRGDAYSSPGEEASWRSRAASLRRDLDLALEEKAATERNLPPAATSSEGTAQRNTLLYPYQVRVDRAQAAVDALADECRLSPACQPGWVR